MEIPLSFVLDLSNITAPQAAKQAAKIPPKKPKTWLT